MGLQLNSSIINSYVFTDLLIYLFLNETGTICECVTSIVVDKFPKFKTEIKKKSHFMDLSQLTYTTLTIYFILFLISNIQSSL